MSGPFVVLAVVVLLFSGYCALRFLDAVRESREQAASIERWWAERAKYRAELAAKGYVVLPANVDPSSVLDDSPDALPETHRALCGEVVRLHSTNDRGPWAA